jgi:hypothetical protein
MCFESRREDRIIIIIIIMEGVNVKVKLSPLTLSAIRGHPQGLYNEGNWAPKGRNM